MAAFAVTLCPPWYPLGIDETWLSGGCISVSSLNALWLRGKRRRMSSALLVEENLKRASKTTSGRQHINHARKHQASPSTAATVAGHRRRRRQSADDLRLGLRGARAAARQRAPCCGENAASIIAAMWPTLGAHNSAASYQPLTVTFRCARSGGGAGACSARDGALRSGRGKNIKSGGEMAVGRHGDRHVGQRAILKWFSKSKNGVSGGVVAGGENRAADGGDVNETVARGHDIMAI